MNSTTLQVLLYALVAGASPLALASTLVLLHGTRARWRSSAFAIGVVLGQATVCALAFALGAASVPGAETGRDERATWAAWITSSNTAGPHCSGPSANRYPPDRNSPSKRGI